MELHELKTRGNLKLNILAKLPDDKIRKRCDAFAHELEQASSSAEKHAALAIQYKQWLRDAHDWCQEVQAEYPHQPAITAQIKAFQDAVKSNATVDKTYALFNTLIKLTEIASKGHTLEIQQSTFVCQKCMTPFINLLSITEREIPQCVVAHG